MITAFHEFELDGPILGPLEKILLYAPLRLEKALHHKNLQKKVIKELGVSTKASINRFYAKTYREFQQAAKKIGQGELTGIQSAYYYPKWWMGFFDIDQANEIIGDIHAFIEEHKLPCAYSANPAGPNCIILSIWVDK